MAEIMQRVCEVKLGGIKLKKEQEQAVIALLEKMFSLFCQLVLVCKMGLTGLHDSYGSWFLRFVVRTFAVFFSVSRPFCCFTLVMKGTSYCLVRRK